MIYHSKDVRDVSPFFFLKECVVALIESLFIQLIHIVMKKLLYTLGQGSIDQVKEVQQLPADVQRFKFFAKNIVKNLHKGSFTTATARVNDDNSITYAMINHKVMMNNTSGKVFTVQNLLGGMHITPDGVKMWKSYTIASIHTDAMEAIVKELGCEWLLAYGKNDDWGGKDYPLLSLLTPASFTRVIKGKVTNPKQLMKHYLTYNGKYRHLKLAKHANTLLDIYVNTDRNSRLHNLLDACATDINPERLIQHASNNGGKLPEAWEKFPFTYDITMECHQLNVKIDHTWSIARLDAEHTKLSRLVREKHIMFMDLIDYSYSQPCPLMPGMELIDNNKRLWNEGSIMKHCIYNYLSPAIDRELFHFHCTFGDKPASLAIMKRFNSDRYVVQQFYGVRNSRVSDDQSRIVYAWLEEPAVQEWFKLERELKKKVDTLPKVRILPF